MINNYHSQLLHKLECNNLLWYHVMYSLTYIIQLTNWILWNGKFYYRDVIKMTITRAKGEGNGHFYHIEVIDLPFHTIPFVSCFISLIENTKKWTFIENLQANLGFLCASKFTGQSIFSFAYYAMFDAQLCAQPRAVRADNDSGRRLSSQDYASIACPMLILIRWPSSDFTVPAHAALCATHIGFMCIMTQNGRVTHGPWNSWWNYFMIMKWYGMSNMKVYGTILVWVI